MDIGISQAQGKAIVSPLPPSWLGRVDMPHPAPDWANTQRLTSTQMRNLLAQIGYNQSGWNYNLIGDNNQLGRYQFSTVALETYGLLAPGSNQAYGIDCINYLACWSPVTVRKNTNSYANYLYNTTSLTSFLTTSISQDYLAYQQIYNLYNELVAVDAIRTTDNNDIVAGMICCAWKLGVGNSSGGAYAWRNLGIGSGVDSFNQGRYAIAILS